ncbi:FapA family protein [Candidatus Neomarinimicrobiota bacterium]
MNEPSIERSDLAVSNGSIRLTSLDEGRLILAELISGPIKRGDLIAAMEDAGIQHGILEHGVDLLTKDYVGQIPIARAEIQQIPSEVESEMMQLQLVDEVESSGKFQRLTELNVSYSVKKGQVLLTFGAPPKTIIRYPQGRIQIVHEHDNLDPELFAGPNTSVNQAKDGIISDINGYAMRTVYGDVAVHPAEKAFGISSAYGKVWKEGTLAVEQDISDGSNIETGGSLIVRGAAHGTYIKAAGNIQITYAVDNRTMNREAKLIAGQSLYCRALDNTPAWAGSHIIVAQGISRCTVECMDTLITPVIQGCKVSVGNQLIVETVRGYSVINLGTKYVPEPSYRSKEAVCTQHQKRFTDLEQRLAQHRFTYNRTRENLARQIEKMRDPTFAESRRYSARQTLTRLFDTLNDAVTAYQQDYDEYLSSSVNLARERVGMDFYQQRMASFRTPRLKVFGTIESGTQIHSPEDRITLRETLSKVMILLEPYTAKLKVVNLE